MFRIGDLAAEGVKLQRAGLHQRDHVRDRLHIGIGLDPRALPEALPRYVGRLPREQVLLVEAFLRLPSGQRTSDSRSIGEQRQQPVLDVRVEAGDIELGEAHIRIDHALRMGDPDPLDHVALRPPDALHAVRCRGAAATGRLLSPQP
jgi:hypothetical protein